MIEATAIDDKTQVQSNFLSDNPFHIFGVPCYTTSKEILKLFDKNVKLARLGGYKFYSDYFIKQLEIQRDAETYQRALFQTNNIDYRLFWFSDKSSVQKVEKFIDGSISISDINKLDSIEDYLVYVFCLFHKSESKLDKHNLSPVIQFISKIRSDYPCIEDLIEIENRYFLLIDSDAKLGAVDLYQLFIDKIDFPLIAFTEKCESFDGLSIIASVTNDFCSSNFTRLLDAIEKKMSLLLEQFVEEYSKFIERILESGLGTDATKNEIIAKNFYQRHSEFIDFVTVYQEKFPLKKTSVSRLNEKMFNVEYRILNYFYSSKDLDECWKMLNLLSQSVPKQKTLEFGKIKADVNQLITGMQIYKSTVIARGLRSSDVDLSKINDIGEYHVILLAYANNSEYQLLLGRIYRLPILERKGFQSIPFDESIGYKWLLRAANLGNAQAQFDVSFAHVEGKGTYKSRSEAITWLKKSASNGNSEAISIIRRYNI